MKTRGLHYLILPGYLAVVLLLQRELEISFVFLSCFPLLLVSISLYLGKKDVGIIGFFLYCLLSLSFIPVTTTLDVLFVILKLVLFVPPSILLLAVILQLENQQFFTRSKTKKPLMFFFLLSLAIIGLFSLVLVMLPEQLLVPVEATQRQIIFLAALTTICCTPFFLSKK